MELKAYWEELDGLTRCHNCAAYNCAEEEYPPRPLPIAPDYIDHSQSRLGKVQKGILPSTVKMILKTYYHLPAHRAPVHPQQQEIPSCPQEEQLKTSLAVQPDDMTGRHRDGEHNPLERPQLSVEEDKVVADGALHSDQGVDFTFQTEVGRNLEAPQVAARHFELAMFRRQQGIAAKITDRGGNYPIQTDFAGKPKTATTARVAAREEAAISRQ